MGKVIKGLVVIVLVIAIAGYFYIGYLQQQHAQQQEEFKQQATVLASKVSSRVVDWGKAIEIFSNMPELAMYLGGDKLLLDEWLDVQKQKVEGLKKIRVVSSGRFDVDKTSAAPLDYADLELLRAAKSSKKIQKPEVHLLGTENKHIAVAFPVVKGAGVKQVILFSFSVSPLKTLFNEGVASKGDVLFELRQEVLNISSNGNQALVSSKNISSLSIPRTRWRIVTKSSSIALPVRQENIVFYALLTLFLLALIYVSARFLSSDENREKLKEVVRRKGAKPKAGIEAKQEPEQEKTMSEIMQAMDEANANAPTDAFVGHVQEKVVKYMGDKKQEVSETDEPQNPLFLKQSAIDVSTKEEVPASIFRAYDIRGVVNSTLTEFGVFSIGRAIGSEALRQGQQTVVIARDGRLHSSRLSESLSKGLLATGCDVVDVGEVPTPVLYFATHNLDTGTGVMLTGSHNPAEYNGLKIVIAGNTLSGDAIQELYKCITRGDFSDGRGGYKEQKMLPEYISEICSDVKMGRLMKVVVDCGNGVAGEVAPMLLSTLGCEVIPMYCEIDGRFPNHHPDPSKPENLQELIEKVKSEGAELGLAFDGDGDRLGVVDSKGNIIWPDRQMMLYAKDVLSRKMAVDIIYDVKCTTNLAKVIKEYGGNPIMSQTGHSLIKAKMRQTKAALAGEMSGHIFFKERWYGFDDALYTAARLMEIVSAEFKSTAEVFAEFPDSVSTPELNVTLKEGENFIFIEQLVKQANFEAGKVITIDGLRVEFADGWGLVRASNTTPSLVMRFEADDEATLERIKREFSELLIKVKPDIALPF
ncbi:MAG: phosphoglucomutase [Cycloclasticus sp. symbiont of Poecilosclerida sp. M]|nr:MAG: phosphoglucomutase [Cycloclasticus sp. symbiont of Poecilosclerida sp. M]